MNMKLAEQYMPLAESMACRRSRNLPYGVTLDEVKSAAYHALVEAASKYDPVRGVSFASYARLRISGCITECFRRPRGLDGHLPEREQEDCFKSVDTDDFFDLACSELCDDHGKMVRMYYVDGRSLKEVGASMGVSESRASQILKKCHHKIKRVLSRKGYE